MSQYPRPRARGYHQVMRLTPAEIASSEVLRVRVLQCRHKRDVIAFAAGISIGFLNKVMVMDMHFAPDVQARLTRWLDKNP
jgi:hypothetical protein